MSEAQCQHIRDDGTRCGIDFGLSSQGLCFHHDPERAEEAAAARSRGGQATAKKLRGKKLEDSELPPLVNHEAAETWTDAIGRAAATGRLSANAANAALRAVREWREAREAGKVPEMLEELMGALSRWKETGDPEPVLHLVEGGLR